MRKLRGTSSIIWNFFDICDDVNKKAVCKYCNNVFSYKSTITNLKYHFKKKHRKAYNEFCRWEVNNVHTVKAESDEDSDEEDTSGPIWSYFERESGGRAKCAICCASVYRHESALTAHLRRKHPKLLANMSPQPSDNQDAQDDEIYTDVIYLEEPLKETPDSPASPVKDRAEEMNKKDIYSLKSRPSTSKYRKRSNSQSSDEMVYKKKRHTNEFRNKRNFTNNDDYISKPVEEDGEIDSFGTYVVCLLKKLPRSVSMKLQRDIINLIMNANLETEACVNRVSFDGNILRKSGNKFYMIEKVDEVAAEKSNSGDATSDNQGFTITVASENENQENEEQISVAM